MPFIDYGGFEKSPSLEVIELGQVAFKKAPFLKDTLMVGLVLLLLGFAMAIFNQVY